MGQAQAQKKGRGDLAAKKRIKRKRDWGSDGRGTGILQEETEVTEGEEESFVFLCSLCLLLLNNLSLVE